MRERSGDAITRKRKWSKKTKKKEKEVAGRYNDIVDEE